MRSIRPWLDDSGGWVWQLRKVSRPSAIFCANTWLIRRQRIRGNDSRPPAVFIRDLIAHRWVRTGRAREHATPKRIHYLSMEFLLGRMLRNNIINLVAEPLVPHALQQEGWDLEAMIEEEPDAGLDNGGLGRLAACFIDSLATLQYPAIGYGLRYEYSIFRQIIRDGSQVERPDNWLRSTDPSYAIPTCSSQSASHAKANVVRESIRQVIPASCQ
jgi:glucan phosphorylase